MSRLAPFGIPKGQTDSQSIGAPTFPKAGGQYSALGPWGVSIPPYASFEKVTPPTNPKIFYVFSNFGPWGVGITPYGSFLGKKSSEPPPVGTQIQRKSFSELGTRTGRRTRRRSPVKG